MAGRAELRSLLESSRDARLVAPGGSIGVECEYAIYEDGSQINFAEIVADVAAASPGMLAAERGARYRAAGAYKFQSDGWYAELSSPPEPVAPDTPSRLANGVLRSRNWLLELLGAYSAATGREYTATGSSMHFNVQGPRGGDLSELAGRVATGYGPLLLFLTSFPGAAGILSRPRPGRLEIACEYVDDPERLRASVTLVLGSLLAALADEDDAALAARSLPRTEIGPSTGRRGWHLRRTAVSPELDTAGRAAPVTTADGSTTSMQHLLELSWDAVAAQLRGTISRSELRLAHDFVSGARTAGMELPPARLERRLEPVDARGRGGVGSRLFEAALRRRRLDEWRLEPAVVHWDFVVFSARRAVDELFLNVPRDFLAAFAGRALDAAVGTLLAAHATQPAAELRRLGDTTEIGVFASVDEAALALQLEDVLHPQVRKRKKPPPQPCRTSIVSPHAIEVPLGCVPYLRPHPRFTFTTPAPRTGTEITAGLTYSGADGTESGVTTSFKVAGDIADVTGEIISVTADVTVIDKEHMPSPDGKVPRAVRGSYVAAFTDTTYVFDSIGLKGHGFHRVSVTVTNAAGLSTTRHLDVQVKRTNAAAAAIELKGHETDTIQEKLRTELEAITDDPAGAKAAAALDRFQRLVDAHDLEVVALEKAANDRPAIHVYSSEPLPGTEADDCRFQIHVIDPDPPGEVVTTLVSSRESQRVLMYEHAPTHYLSSDPPTHALVPPYVGHRGDYPNPAFRRPLALKHDPGPLPVQALYRPTCNATAMALQVSIAGDSFGYCNADEGAHPGEVDLVATGLPSICTVGGEPVPGKYLWDVIEKPVGSSPSIEPPDAAAVKVVVDQPGHYRVRVLYYISQMCSLVCDEYEFDVYQPVPALASEELVAREDEVTKREWLALTADHETADFVFGITMRTVAGEAVPLPGEAGIDWSSLGPAALDRVGAERTIEGASADVLYPTRVAPSAPISVAVGVDLLPVDGRDRDVRGLVLGSVVNTQVVAGEAKRLELYGRRTAADAWEQIATIDQPSSASYPTWTEAGQNLRLKLGRTGSDQMDVQCRPYDAQGNALEDGSHVEWRVDGVGEVELHDRASEEIAGGAAWATLHGGLVSAPVPGSPASAGAQLLRIAFHSATQDEKNPAAPDPTGAGGKFFWLGTTLLGAKVEIAFVPGTLDTAKPPPGSPPSKLPRIRRDPAGVNLTRVEVTVTLEGRPAAGAEVGWSITKGSIRGDGAAHFSTSSWSVLDANGKAQASLSDVYCATDGTPNSIHNLAWGEVDIFATVGQPHSEDRFAQVDGTSGVLQGEFNNADLVRRPRNIWPMTNFLSQGNFTFVPKPFSKDSHTFTADVQLQGTPGKRVYNEIVQDRQLTEFVRFDFSYGNFTTQGHTFSGARNAVVHPPPISFQMYGSPRLGALVGHGWDLVANAPSAMRIEPSKLASLYDAFGSVRGAEIQGLTNFEAEFSFRPDAVDDTHVVLEGTGGDAKRGRWTIERRGGGTMPCEVQATFLGHACDSLPQVTLTTGWLGVTPGAWNRIRLRVGGSAADKKIVVDLTVNGAASSSATSSVFNWLSGDSQRVYFGLANTSWFDVAGLVVRGEINSVMNMIRPDGVVVPRQWVVLDGSGRGALKVSTEELRFGPGYAALPRPAFDLSVPQNHVAPFAQVVTTYCDTWDFDTEVCPAMSDAAIRITRGESEFAYGFVFGTGTGWEGVAGDMVAGMVGIGDLRDILRNLAYLAPGGEEPDWTNFGLAVCGLALSIGEIFSAGTDTPENFLVSFLRTLLVRVKDSRLASVIVELLMKLVKEWRYAVKAVQLGLTAYSFWPVIEALWNFLLHDKVIPRKVSEFAAFVNSLRDRIESIMLLVLNPVRTSKDLTFVGRLLRQMQITGLPDREIKRVITMMVKGKFNAEVSRVVGAMLELRRTKGLPQAPVTEKMIRGFAHYVFLHGEAAAARFNQGFRDNRKLFRILTQIDTLYESLAGKLPPGELNAAMRRLTAPLRLNARTRQFAIHELEVACWFRRFLTGVQPLFRKKPGVDFVMKVGGAVVWLEAKSIYAFQESARLFQKDKIRKQFVRFVEERCRQQKVGRLASFSIQYVFRDTSEHSAIYARAIEEAIAECRHKLPPGFSANQVRILFWGLPRP